MCLYVHVWCLYVQYMCGVCMYMCCVCMYMCGVCMYMCAVHVLCVVSMCCVWCLCAVCGVHVLCVVSIHVCCNSCPFFTLPLLVLLHKSCVPHQLTHDAHNMTYAQYYMYCLSILWPFFPLLLIYFNDLQLPTITYQHRIAQYLHT